MFFFCFLFFVFFFLFCFFIFFYFFLFFVLFFIFYFFLFFIYLFIFFFFHLGSIFLFSFFFFLKKKREIQSNLSEQLWLLVIYKLITVFVLYAMNSWYIFHITLVFVYLSQNSRIIVFHLITIFFSHVVGYLFDWTLVLYGTASDPRGGSRISKGGVDGRPYLLRGGRENALTKKIGNNFTCTCLRRVF